MLTVDQSNSPSAGDAERLLPRLTYDGMPAALLPTRGQGTLVAIGFPLAVLAVLGLWLALHGFTISTSLPAAVVLVAMVLLAERIDVVVSPRMHVSPAGGFVVAAGLIGGPLLGACAGAAVDAPFADVAWRKSCAWGGADALQGFVVGLVGQQLVLGGSAGALALAAVGLLTAVAMNGLAVVVVAFDRKVKLGSEVGISWRTQLLTWLLAWPPLAAFVFLFRRAPWLALALAAGLLALLWLGNRVRLGLEQRLAEEQLRARLDALTGAPNRYALAEALKSEHARIMRGGRTAALFFLDLDRFKTVNDTHGYAAGDRLLVDVYQRLRNELRASDQIFRWGGEEFVVLAPQVERNELADVAERLRLLLATKLFSIDGKPRTVTGSVGGVLLDDTRSAEAALEAASRLVRQAKLTRDTALVETAHSGSGIAAGAPQAAARVSGR